MVRLLIIIASIGLLVACVSQPIQVINHQARKKVFRKVIDVAKTDSTRQDYELRGQENELPVIYQSNDSSIIQANYPYVFGLKTRALEDSLNQKLQKHFLEALDTVQHTRYITIDYQISQLKPKELTFTQIILSGMVSPNNFKAKNYVLDLQSGDLQEIPYLTLEEVFKEDLISSLISLLTEQFAAQEKRTILIDQHRLHIVWGEEEGIFYFTGSDFKSVQKLIIPKSKLRQFIKAKYQN